MAMAVAIELYIVFLFPETKWHRLHPDELAKQHFEGAKTSQASSEKADITQTEKVNRADAAIAHVQTDEEVRNGSPNPLTASETAQRDPYLGKGRPAKWQFKLYQPNAHPFKSILLDLWVPWKLFAFPIVEFASFVTSWSCSSFLTLNLTQSQVFAGKFYFPTDAC